MQDAPAAALALTAGAHRVYDRQGIEYTAYSILHPAHEQSALELATAAQTARDDAEKALEKLNRAKKNLRPPNALSPMQSRQNAAPPNF